MDTDKQISSMLVNFHSVGNCCILLGEKGIQQSYPDVYMSKWEHTVENAAQNMAAGKQKGGKGQQDSSVDKGAWS